MTFLNILRAFNFGLIRSGFVSCLSVAIVAAVCVIGAAAQAHEHITFCHRTGSASNPYIQISPDVESVIKQGHLDHDQIGNGPGGDIIPFFEFQGQTYSKNLNTDFGGGLLGRMILDNGCEITDPTPTATPTATCSPGMSPTPTPGMINLEILPCESNHELRRIRFIGRLLNLSFFLNGLEVVPDANGEVVIDPGHYHWEVFGHLVLLASGDFDIGPCNLIITPTPTSTPTETPTPTPGMTPTPTPPEVPEPRTILLLGTGLLIGLGIFAFRKLGGR